MREAGEADMGEAGEAAGRDIKPTPSDQIFTKVIAGLMDAATPRGRGCSVTLRLAQTGECASIREIWEWKIKRPDDENTGASIQ